MTEPIRVMIADDHPLILMGTALSLADEKQFIVTGKARNSTELMALLGTAPCDVLVCDLAMPGGRYGDGLPLIDYILRHYPHVHVIVQTMLDNPGILKGLQQSGVRGVLNKGDDLSLITVAVTTVVKGGWYLAVRRFARPSRVSASASRRAASQPCSANAKPKYCVVMLEGRRSRKLHRA